MTSRPTRLLLFSLALVVVLLAASCSGDEESSPPTTAEASPASTATSEPAATTTDPAPATTATTAPLSDEAAILAAVDGYWTVLIESNAPPDPDHPDLDRYLTGAALERSRQVARDRLELSQAVRLPEKSIYSHDSTIVSIDGDLAVVEDCGIDDGILYDVGSGMTLNDAIATTLAELTVLRVAGDWKVSDNLAVERWDGAVGCE